MRESDMVFGKITVSGHPFAFKGGAKLLLSCVPSVRSGLRQLISYGIHTTFALFMVGSIQTRI